MDAIEPGGTRQWPLTFLLLGILAIFFCGAVFSQCIGVFHVFLTLTFCHTMLQMSSPRLSLLSVFFKKVVCYDEQKFFVFSSLKIVKSRF